MRLQGRVAIVTGGTGIGVCCKAVVAGPPAR